MDIEFTLSNGTVSGYCDPQFEPVCQQFINNFEHRGELGASLNIQLGNETLVDLWGGGVPSKEQPRYWQKDTLSVIFSCTKAATALSAHLLIDQGKLDLHAPVADYWPEFATNGKQQVTVAMMLNHTAGVPALRAPVRDGGYCDWDYMVKRLSEEQPFWPPGTRNGYHMMTFGWTVGELVRRVSGLSLGEYFHQNIAAPLGLDFWIGLPEQEFPRVSRMKRWKPVKGEVPAEFTRAMLADKNSLQFLAFMNSGGFKTDAPESYKAELGGGGGISNARSLAGMYVPLANGGEYFSEAGSPVSLLSGDHVELMKSVSAATLEDATLLMPSRFSFGFMRSMDNRHRASGAMESCVLGKEAFGHAGAGGSIGFADTDEKMAFGYTMNQMGGGILLNERGQSLVDAAYQCLGYRTNKPGFWIK